MARNPRTVVFCREIGTTLASLGFHEAENGRNWWLRSDAGDYLCVDVQSSRTTSGVLFVNIAIVPGPHFEWIKWVRPNGDYDEPTPALGISFIHERVRPAEAPWDTDLMLNSRERAKELGGFVARDLVDPVLPRILKYLDRDILLAKLDSQQASAGVARGLRAAFLAEAGDLEGAQRAYGPAENDDENQARYREWLREYALAHQLQ